MSNRIRSILRITLVVCLVFLQILSYCATRVSLGNGAWDNGGTWSGGVVPNCGDSVVISLTHTVTIANHQDYSSGSPMRIAIYGTMKFANGKKMQLSCGSYIYIYPTGKVVPGSGGGNSNYIEICNVVVWRAADGTWSGSGCFGCSMILPVELVKFELDNFENEIGINWSTATELNTNYFEIEKSLDGIKWELLAAVKAAENSTHVLYYEHTDARPTFGTSYYRLKTVNKDQSFEYSDIRSVERIKKESHISILPNPSHGSITISFAYETSSITYIIFDVSGKIIHSSTKESTDNKISLDVSDLGKGLYFVNTSSSDGNQINNNKIIIE